MARELECGCTARRLGKPDTVQRTADAPAKLDVAAFPQASRKALAVSTSRERIRMPLVSNRLKRCFLVWFRPALLRGRILRYQQVRPSQNPSRPRGTLFLVCHKMYLRWERGYFIPRLTTFFVIDFWACGVVAGPCSKRGRGPIGKSIATG